MEKLEIPYIAQIGIGHWGKNVCRDLNKIGVLKTICETNKDILNNIKTEYPNLQISDWKSILNDTSITAIFITLPAEYHYSFTKEALEYNKDVFVEKPLSLNLNEGEELVKLANFKNKILMVGHVLRYHPCIKKIEEIVKKGEIGNIYYIDCSRKNLGIIRKCENVLWSFAPHDISLVLSLNKSKPKSIKCIGQQHLNNIDITDTFLVFPDNCVAHINVNWLFPFKEQKITIVGSKGILVFDDTKQIDEKLSVCYEYLTEKTGDFILNKTEFKYIKCDWSDKLPLQLECEHFIDCCKYRKTPLTDGKEGLDVLTILDTCHKQLLQNITSTNHISDIKTNYFSHETAIIGEQAIIGEGSKIWHYSHIQGQIGINCSIGQNCYLSPKSILGNNCKVQNNVSIYDGVICEDDVFLGPSMVFCNDINPRSAFPKNGDYMKTLVKKGVSIGANATILPGITINEFAFIGAGAVITKDVPAYATMAGNPAKQISSMNEKGIKII
jgi:UDP-2-acetamido-3-amino-2,3-dideoxy-glucuronate N-acetyltransferase